MERIGLEAVFLTSDFSRGVSLYLRGIGNVERETQKVSRSGVGGFDAWTGAIIGASSAITSRLIDALVDLGAHTARALGGGVQEAANLESQISGIRSVISITDEQADALRQTMFDIALDPGIQADIFDVADAMDIAARAGARFDDLVGGLTRNILILANATGGEYFRAADILTSAQIVWNQSIEETEASVNSITAAINTSKLSLDDYRFALSNAGGAANVAGVEFDDFNKLLAAAVPAFSGGRRAGQGFASMLSALVPISKRQINAFQQLGLITFDLEKGMQVLAQNGIAPVGNTIGDIAPQLFDLAQNMGFVTKEGAEGEKQFQAWARQIGVFDNALFDANGDLKEANELIAIARTALEGLTSEQQIELTTSAFGREGMDFFIALGNVDPTRLAELNAEFERTNAVDIAAMRMDNFNGAMEQLKDTIHATTTGIGLELLPALTDLTRLLTALIASRAEGIISFFEQVGIGASTFATALMEGQSVFSAFNTALGETLRNLNYGAQSIETLQAVLTRLNEILDTGIRVTLQFVAENAVALTGAFQGMLVALAVAGAITALAGALAFLTSPIGLLLAASAALGAAWSANFLGMRDAVLWFWDTVQPALQSAIALGALLAQSVGQLANDFIAGWNAAQGATNTAVSGIGQAMFELGRLAHGWGVGLVNALAEGIIAAVGAVVSAINQLGSVIAYWLTPGSPPPFLPDLDKWGTGAAEAYLEGWTEADFNSLSQFGSAIGQILQSMVSSGQLDESASNPILLAVREQMAAAIEELNQTGSVSQAAFDAIQQAGGAAGEEIAAFAQQFIALNAAMALVEETSERLTAATEAQTDAQDELDDILSRIQSGDSSVTMDDYRAAQARLRAAKQERKLAEEQNKEAKDAQTEAQKEFDLFKARMGIQTETLSIIGQQKAIMERLASLAKDQAAKIKEGLTDLEKQIKAQQMITAQYNDRIRLAELDAILNDEKATAQEKELARQEKNLILLQMQQRAIEAAELGIDLSVVDQLPIVLETAAQKAGKLAGADSLGAIPPLGETINDLFGGINDKTTEWRDKTNEVLGGVNKIKEGLGLIGSDLPKLEFPFLQDLQNLLNTLNQPIQLPALDFTSFTPPQGLLDFANGFSSFVGSLREISEFLTPSFQAFWDRLFGGIQDVGFTEMFGAFGGFNGIMKELVPLTEALNRLWTEAQPLVNALANLVGLVFFNALGVALAALNGIIGGLTAFLQGTLQVLTGLANTFAGIFGVVTGFAASIVALVQGNNAEVTRLYEEMRVDAELIMTGLWQTIVGLWNTLVGTVAGIIDGFYTTIIDYFTRLYTELVGASIIPDMVNEIIAWFQTLDDEAWAIVNQMWEDIMTAFDTAKQNLLDTVTDLVEQIVSIFTETDWGKLGKDLVSNIADGIVNNLGRIGRAARELVSTLIGSAINAITSALGGGGTTPSANDPNTNSGGGLPNNAQGTNYWRGGLTNVGEQGAELISMANRAFLANRPMVLDLPRGTQILDATATRNVLGRGGSFGTNVSPASISNQTTIINNNEYYISTNSSPMAITQALAVKQVLDPA